METASTPLVNLPNGVTPQQIGAAISPRFQQLILLPTEKCNFRCTYCYEDFSLGKMSKTLQRAIELFLERRVPQLKGLNFSWFGGEPLLAKDVIFRISSFAKDICARHSVNMFGGMTTNGYLLVPRLAEDLINLQQNFFQITLDGWQAQHDETRRRADGRGTFDAIWENIKGIQELERNDFQVQLRIHMTWDNMKSVRVLIENVADQFGHDRRFSLDFQHIRNLGGAGGKSIKNGMTWDDANELERELEEIWLSGRRKAPPLPSNDGASGIQLDMESGSVQKQVHGGGPTDSSKPPYICYASKPNSLLIRANGRIGKCTVAFHDPRNDLGYLSDDGEITINNAKLQPWIRGIGSLDPTELGCPMVKMETSDLESPQRRVIPIHAAA